jgi:peptidyl-prolyl cis-trans isomerase C
MLKPPQKMKKTNFVKILLINLLLLISTHLFAQNAAVVNGTPIPLSKLDRLVQSSGQENSPEIRNKARDVLITKELINQEANKRGITKDPQVQDALEQAKLGVLVSAVFEDWISKDGINDKDLQSAYDAMKSQMGGKEYKVSHILVENEKLAKSLLTQIKAGANFGELAKSNSLDKGSAVQGGSLDWVSPSSLVAEFSDAMKALSPGQISPAPVKSQFGWHIIKVEDVREQKIPTLAEVKPQLIQMLTQDQNFQKTKFMEMMESFKSKAKIQ